jgi:hypothetical protein
MVRFLLVRRFPGHQKSWLKGHVISTCLLRHRVLPNSIKLSAAMLSMTIAQAVITWFLVCCDRRRAPGYEWGDWKLRKD